MSNDLFGAELSELPDNSSEAMAAYLSSLNDKLDEDQKAQLMTEKVQPSLLRVFYCSQFIQDACLRTPSLLPDLVTSADLFNDAHRDSYADRLELSGLDKDAELMCQLRVFRRREMVRIAWRDLAGWSELNETLRDLTALAEVCIQKTLDFLYTQACNRRGVPALEDGTPINLVVLGMGKLGAWELNYSSDIDLIFAYERDGVLQDRKETTYGEFFTRICRSLVKFLDETTVDGFVFRTDVRLRPFGDSGPLVMTFDGMENYYLTQAREWERYAMIKARQVAGDFVSGEKLMQMIRPFVYRRYLDYGAFEELRSLKFQITQELKRKDRMENVKLGPGGIREIEFIGQAFQLIRGGQELELQQREIMKILASLQRLGLMQERDSRVLQSAYTFLRRVENHIQQYQDKQVHDLPGSPQVQQILAYSMGFPGWTAFKAELDSVRDQVHEIFDQVFAVEEQEAQLSPSHYLWSGMDDEQALEQLGDYGYYHCKDALKAIRDFKLSNAVKRLTAKGALVLDRLIPQVIECIAQTENRDETLFRVLGLLEAVAGRNVYFSLLAENPDALKQLVTLSSASAWICEYLAQYPVLFDELLDARSLFEPLDKQSLANELANELAKVDVQDDERLMISLRQFKHINILRVAAADIMGVIPVMVVSDYLTWTAEVIVEQVVSHAWRISTARHGYPPGTTDQDIGFGVLGLGKMGGIELGYGSDLDMVFLYASEDGHAMTDGPKPLTCTQFYIRLGQKIRHILDAKMLSGVLYEVDLRLRPSGDSGLLVSHIDTYETYLHNEAWTWEHQALVRGRFIAGDTNLKQKYQFIRKKILSSPRDITELQKEVREMREKMRDNLAPKSTDVFDLKQSKGGIADIEFIVQFGVLANAAEDEALTTYTDNVRLLERLAHYGFISREDAELLKRSYCTYRDFGHRQVLQGLTLTTDAGEFGKMRAEVERIWVQLMES